MKPPFTEQQRSYTMVRHSILAYQWHSYSLATNIHTGMKARISNESLTPNIV